MTIKFVNRGKELDWLEGFEKRVAVIFGRRRIGKTRLVKEFIERYKGEKALYFLAIDKGLEANLERFSLQLAKRFGVPGLRFASFKEMFEFIETRKVDVVVLDEFGYLAKRGALAEFQEIIDEVLSKKLILTGSTISVMESKVLDYNSPIYGRIDALLNLLPLGFQHVLEWFKGNNVEELVKIYACCDGIPRYMEFFSGKNAEKEIVKNFFNQAFMFYDARKVLEQELREPYTYFSILEAISHGRNSVSEIADYSKVKTNKLPFYLHNLQRLKVIKRELPVVGKRKFGVYRMLDNYFDFWFGFVYPFEDEIDSQVPENAMANFNKSFNEYLGRVFEKVCKHCVLELSRKNKLFFKLVRIGRQWGKFKGEKGKNTYEIDIVALSEKNKKILFCECKWQDRVNAEKLLIQLQEKAKHVNWHKDNRREYYALFAKSFKKKIKKENVKCFDLKDLQKSFKG